MPVGHGGDESKHPAWVKLAILKFIEKRFKDIIIHDDDERVNDIVKNAFYEWIKRLEIDGIQEKTIYDLRALAEENPNDMRRIMAERIIKVYDPITTENDFYIFFNVNWDNYLYLYHKYYHTSKTKEINDIIESVSEEMLNDPQLKTYILNAFIDIESEQEREIAAKTRIINSIKNISSAETDITFNASKSKSVIFYTVEQMKNILLTGYPDPVAKREV